MATYAKKTLKWYKQKPTTQWVLVDILGTRIEPNVGKMYLVESQHPIQGRWEVSHRDIYTEEPK